ncbi:hypothetical protein G647_01215 [Cladophialophora carrionii CBS 160.54]|uniref:Uncharacterized protein n=1 Tax=Cladophialophora carrionii CBS 160.54 TaxID=1279043 RepID=V9DPD9_9EURO|nr:uncharacterized protein G647_01215 [Cladophialophora carrionii CBS 160.54]ETI28764.1 hypothetical protein G647_01215 [Cladophialophora carrionii CBS 160.54]
MASILAARDQENLIHAHQTTAAGKHLNQNIRALHSKTPANLKTPFRSAKNDENLPITLKAQKNIGRDGPSKEDKGSFVTPVAPRNRAPLGAKTTNARAFQTPAPLTLKPGKTHQKASTGGRRSNRSKIAVARSEPVDTDVLLEQPLEEEEPDFGYAPPAPVELPDPPIEFEEDHELTEELRRGYGLAYPVDSPKDENGFSLRLRKEEEEWKKQDEERIQKSLEELGKPIFPTVAELNKQVNNMIAAGPKKRAPLSRVDSTEARCAVAALSEPQPRLPSAATRSTQASEQKKRDLLLGTKPASLAARNPPTSTRPNHSALSRNTIGFPKAKKAPSIMPRSVAISAPKPVKIDQGSIHPRDFRDLYGSPPVESDMWFRLKKYELLEEDLAKDNADIEEELFESDFFPFDNAKLDDEDFQLPMPE